MNDLKILELLELIESGAVVATSTRRLARHILLSYDSFMESKGGSLSWETPVVMPIGALLASLMQEGVSSNHPVTLPGSTGARAIWEEVVLNDRLLKLERMPFTESLINSSFNAYALLNEYQLELPGADLYLTEEALALKRWIASYRKSIRTREYLSPCELTGYVTRMINRGEGSPLAENVPLILAGFDEITPAMDSLIGALSGAGVEVGFWPVKPVCLSPGNAKNVDIAEELLERITIKSFHDENEELISVTRWVRKNLTPGVRIGIIVPDLSTRSGDIEREFASVLAPDSVLIDNVFEVSNIFNISHASRLSDNPLVESALEIISVTNPRGVMDTGLLFKILSSPYLHPHGDPEGSSEMRSIQEFYAGLRGKNRSEYTLGEFAWEGPKIVFVTKVKSWIKILKDESLRALPSVWAGRFSALLKKLSWPSNVIKQKSPESQALLKLKSPEYQAFEALNELLADFASLDDIVGSLSRGEAASRLRRMASATTHRAESPATPVQILDPFEATGLSFDHLWIMGATAENFPAKKSSPNPFMPFELNKSLGLKGSTIESEAMLAAIILTRLINSADSVIASFPESADDKLLRVTPFFRGLEIQVDSFGEELTKAPVTLTETIAAEQVALEEIPSVDHVEFASCELEGIRGGTSIFKDQSGCSFRAFAIHRLGAKVIEAPEAGLTYMEKGSILHEALKGFWEKVKDSTRLDELIRSDRLATEVREVVKTALVAYEKKNSRAANYLGIERERVTALILDWLKNVEALRTPFRVEKLESEEKNDIFGLNVRIIIDRIDSLGRDGELGRALIDYKSGQCSKNDWLTERPKEPQMLIYNQTGKYEAVSYARIRPGECAFDGISSGPDMLYGIKEFEKDKASQRKQGVEEYDELLGSWDEVLKNLATGFLSGETYVDPRQRLNTNESACKYCNLTPLCRIFVLEADGEREEGGHDLDTRS